MSAGSPVDLIVHGAAGRMGRRVLALAAERAKDFRIVAGVDQKPGKLADLGIAVDAPILDRLPAQRGAVVVDFSHHAAFTGVCAACAAGGMALVSGTTGLEPAAIERGLGDVARAAAALHAQNFSVGVNVLFRIAALVAKSLGEDYDIEIVEAHHNQKIDAPSGTAYGIADAILAATGRTRADLVHGRSGTPGKRTRREIGMHALRMGDVVGDHTAYYVGNGERVTVGHVAHNRDVFAAGALRAAAFLAGKPPGRYGMGDVLGI